MLRTMGLLGLLLIAPALWATEVDIAVGTERFLWKEYADNGSQLLEESGWRHFVAIRGDDDFAELWRSSFTARFYSGVVDYDGQTQSGIPVGTDVDYNGIDLEVGMHRRIGQLALQPGEAQWWLDFVLGYDLWRRHLRDTRTAGGSLVVGYTERYRTFYGRLGARYEAGTGWQASLGLKLPFHTKEQVDLGDTRVTLNPEGRLSLYAGAAYAFTPAWQLSLGYDSYRFAKSDRVEKDGFLYHQPESDQDTVALALHYRF